MAPTRYQPDAPFPPYSYVPGRGPHPLNDPRGHLRDGAQRTPKEPNAAHRYAVDLWNAGYYWEAHEAWEALWHAAGRRGRGADFFKGLIKLAAAGVKAREGRPLGVERHLLRAEELFRAVAAESDTLFHELRPTYLCSFAGALRATPLCPDASRAAPVMCVWDHRLVMDV